jgi:hypothetical protein
MKILFYDFEVFKYDWMVVIIDYTSKEKTIIINDSEHLTNFYMENIDSIWVGFNSRMYDQWILKGIILGKNPYEISCKLIIEDMNGYQILPEGKNIKLNNFDISTGFHSLKQLEGFMGSKIKESDVDFNIDRPLTESEIKEIKYYCTHDVEETIKVFEARREEFDSQLSMIETFELEMDMFNKTKAQLSAYVLGANNKTEYNDEFELQFPDTLVLNKYKYVYDWYIDKKNRSYESNIYTEIAGVPHIFAWGGIHGAISNYFGEGNYIMSDIASMYPALMIEYHFLSRNVEYPEKYREIRDKRLVMKKNKDPRQLPLKIVLNGTFGASKDKHNNLYDPLMANNVCVSGQLLLLDLIEKVEPYGELIQSNTDGILFKVNSEENKQKYLEECKKWSKRTRLDLEHDEYVKVVQKDVNNYIIVDAKGNYKSKGGYVKKLSKVDYDLPIINKALINYFTKGISIKETIDKCDDLIEFQKIVKVSRLYQYAKHNDKIIKEKVLRVFASNDDSDGTIYKIKTEDRIEKIANTPEKCFIFNEEVIGVKIPDKLDKEYYITVGEKRLQDFINSDKKEKKPKSDIKGINAIIKSQISDFLDNDESDNIMDFIINLKENITINKGQFEIFAKLNFFSKFGKSKKLINFYDIYSTLINRKTIKHTDINKYPYLNVELLNKYSEKITETKFSNIDMYKILLKIFNSLEDKGYTLREKLEFESKYYGKLKTTSDKFPKNVYFVQDIETGKDKTKPKLTLYNLKYGDINIMRIENSHLFLDNPFKQNSIIVINKTYKKPKSILINGKWVKSKTEFNTIIEDYDIYINNEERI